MASARSIAAEYTGTRSVKQKKKGMKQSRRTYTQRPAGSRDREVPGLGHGLALDLDEEGTQAYGDIHGDDDEPDECLHLALGKAEQGNGETGF
jgi:hypothetical protein